jgi:hypothetical protein
MNSSSSHFNDTTTTTETITVEMPTTEVEILQSDKIEA